MRAAFLAAILSLAALATTVAAAPPPIVLLVVMDGTRANGLGCLDVGAYVAPAVQRLCDGGVAFTRAYAQSSWGAASFTTLMTGLLPSVHGVNAGEDALAPGPPTIATVLADAGWVTAGFTSEADVQTRGLLRGFAESKLLPMDDIPGYRFDPAERTVLTMLDWVRDHRRDLATKGAFLLMHTSPGRFGYLPSLEYLRRFAPVTDYERIALLERRANQFQFQFGPKSLAKLVVAADAGIALADGALALVLAELRAPELSSRLWIVFVSTYGEARMEHGLVGHGITLYDEAIRVPLVVVPPYGRGGGERREGLVEIADVMPTILEIAELPAPADLRGRSLLPTVEGSRLPDRQVVSELVAPNALRIHARTVVDPTMEKTFQRQDGNAERYDLRYDPGERNNLARP